MASPVVNLRLLGGFQLRLASGTPIDIVAKKTRALLAYLALPAGRDHAREKLVGLLWGDRDEEQARNSLRQALTELNRAFAHVKPSPLLKVHDTICLDVGVVEVDVEEFQRRAACDDADNLRKAAALYQGDLLNGIGVHDPAFEEWLRVEQQRLRDLVVTTLEKLLSHEEGQDAIAVARRLLTLDPFREEGYRALMRLHAEAGEIGAALQQYETCRETLQRELSVEPSPETEALHRDIMERPKDRSALPTAPAPEPTQDKPSIAILPFENIGGDPAQQYFSDGVSEDIITALSKFNSLFVIARNSSFQYRGAIEMKRVGHELGVRYLVEGSVRQSGEMTRVAAQLINAETGVHLWAESYDRKVEEIFAVQDELSRRIVSTLAVRLEAHELARTKHKPPENMRAYECWLHGKKLVDLHTADGFAAARQWFERAVQADPNYARGYSGLAYVYNMAPFYSDWGGSPLVHNHEQAFRFATKAVQLDEMDYMPHFVLGWCQLWRRNYGEATREFELALALNPNDADFLAYRGFFQIYMGEPEAAVETVEAAIRLNPHRPDWYIAHLVCALFMAKRYEEAMAAGEGLRDVWPEYSAWMASLFGHAGRLAEAKARAATFMKNVRNVWTGDRAAGSNDYVRWMLNWNPFRRQSDIDHFLDGLRRAGLLN